MPDVPIHVLVVEDDLDTADYLQLVLERDEIQVTAVDGAAGALLAVGAGDVDIVLTDIELPGMSGLDLISEVRREAPQLPVIVITGHQVMDYAVEALRQDADEFYLKPVNSKLLVRRVRELVADARSKVVERGTVLAVGAHPDDVEIGVGATLAQHAARGDRVVILTLSGGAVGGDVIQREVEARDAAAVIGARLELRDFQDTHLDPASGVTAAVEELVAEVQPMVIYTHSEHERHQDHRAVHRAVEIAARRTPVLACFQSPSTTIDYRPTRFVPVDDQIETKLQMLAAYRSQQHRSYMAPELVRATARYWSRFGTATYSEPLEVVHASAPFTITAEHSADLRPTIHVPDLRVVNQ